MRHNAEIQSRIDGRLEALYKSKLMTRRQWQEEHLRTLEAQREETSTSESESENE